MCEGGPSLNAQLLGAGVVDELCATTGPMLVGGSSKRMIEAMAPDTPEPLRLDRLLEADGVLLARYVARLNGPHPPPEPSGRPQCDLGSVALSRRTSRWKSAGSSKPL